jgi:isopenicillin N synthase-like dioxygenase
MTAQTIPVLDLEDFAAGGVRARAFNQELESALREVGFLALIGHGVGGPAIEELYQAAAEVFALPEAEKLGYERPEVMGQRGYTRFGREHAKDHQAPDLKEYWTIGPEEGADYPGNVWPQQVPAFRERTWALWLQLSGVAEQLLEALSLALGEPRDRLSGVAEGGDTVLRVIHYPPVPDHADPASVRAAAHEDINLLTLLCGATAEGLEIYTREGTWLPIRAMPGQLIVDSGDMMQRLSNGWFRSCTHRVVNPDASRERRYSMPFFVHPRPDVDLTPLPSCVARTGGEPRFGSLTAGEFLRQRLGEIGLGT